jgi:hypothetical protein
MISFDCRLGTASFSTLRFLRRQLVHELRPSRVRVSAVEYKGHLIEAFEDQPGRWFAYFRRLDGQNITSNESNSLRTPSARYCKEDAIEFAKETIDGLQVKRQGCSDAH